MTWTKLGDTFTDDPRLLEVSRSARMLHVEALVYCNRHLRDGHLPKGALARITDAEDPALDALALERAGLWEEAEGGWLVDWTDQESADEVRERQRYRADKQKRYRDRKNRHERGDHGDCDPRYCKKAVTGHVTGNGDGNVTGRVTPSRPVPSRPKTGTGTDSGSGRAGARPPAALQGSNPRVLSADDRGVGDDDLTPWDLLVRFDDTDGGHASIEVQPPPREVLTGYTVEQIENGEQWLVHLLSEVFTSYDDQIATLRAKHKCDPESFYCDLAITKPPEPLAEVWVPRAVAEAWLDRVWADLEAAAARAGLRETA